MPVSQPPHLANIGRRRVLAGIALAMTTGSTRAQRPEAFPSRPITWVVPFPPGGAVDAIARIISRKMSESIGQQVVVDNRAGSGGIIGSDLVAKAPSDGHTILINSTGLVVDRFFYPRVPYQSDRDFVPVVLAATLPSVLVVPADSRFRDITQLLKAARENPGKLSFASAGLGTSIHLASALLAARANVELLHVPYRGSSPAVSDLVAGRVDMMIDSVTSQRQNILAKRVRALGVTSLDRHPQLPEVPTIAEAAGLPGFEVLTWCGVFAPKGTPRSVVERLNAEINKAIAAPDVVEALKQLGIKTAGGAPEVLADLFKSETERWQKLIVEHRLNANQ
ncbi:MULTISPECIES: tripartite tricarboxylate transporter substrate binding protein [Burkholderiales]|uniref:Tripartite tricarboxylate transporter substrate binding protein n=8 Tax=Pseudomonadota TaxID=1224 RepID=A0A7M2HBZ3_9BURK|nr:MULTISPECIES: tripartite tricarboxylate transporter substrate binding protein [Burkholderiales]AEV57159.1 hypothetical protein [uncultured bacterium]QEH80961.1 tripartite tricarboxylate transporter substrate binding protein [Sphingomonas sp. C8-2]CAB89823.1 hypothetical protein [Pseudomonas chlororaphis]AAL86583.1 hypothetical protein [Delftia acidovorans]ADP19848.1 extra-cytoplasmic solute receptor family protein 183 [Achromobacter xylosoxidans A8]